MIGFKRVYPFELVAAVIGGGEKIIGDFGEAPVGFTQGIDCPGTKVLPALLDQQVSPNSPACTVEKGVAWVR